VVITRSAATYRRPVQEALKSISGAVLGYNTAEHRWPDNFLSPKHTRIDGFYVWTIEVSIKSNISEAGANIDHAMNVRAIHVAVVKREFGEPADL
jgi:hypothetical protein